MPCGPLQSMQIVALASANPFYRSAVEFFLCARYHSADARIRLDCSRSWQTLYKTGIKMRCHPRVVMGLSMMSQGTDPVRYEQPNKHSFFCKWRNCRKDIRSE